MTLPIQISIQMQEAMEDQVITHAEATRVITTVFGSAVGAILIAFGMVMFSKVLGGNPSSNPGILTDEIITRAGLRPYELKFIPREEEPIRKRKPPAVVRSMDVGPYRIRQEFRDDHCIIKLYEYLPGLKRKLVATKSEIGYVECEKLFKDVVDTINQVRFEHKTALRR